MIGIDLTDRELPEPVPPMTEPSATFHRGREVLSRMVGDDVIVAIPGRDDFDFLTGPAAAIWDMLDRPCSTADIVDRLASIYAAEPDVIAAGLADLIGELVSHGAVEATDAGPA